MGAYLPVRTPALFLCALEETRGIGSAIGIYPAVSVFINISLGELRIAG
jgi:hypothetical protein